LAQRKRKKKKARRSGAAFAEARAAKTEAKNAAVRAQLEPLDPDERPLPVTIGAIVAVVLVAVQIPLYFAFDGEDRPPITTFLFFTVLMLVMAWGMWQSRYWAVLGFQALLALAILVVALAMTVASNVWTVVLCLAIVVPAGALFWFMIKALARIQMPDRPGSA
jgi:cation transport ATPase